VAVGYEWQGQAWGVAINARNDKDSAFGTHTSGSAALSWRPALHWRLSASGGTAYRAPTLYQRYSAYGTPNLRLQHSRQGEIGAVYAAGGVSYGLHVFQQRFSNLISFADERYYGVPTARTQGLSMSLSRPLLGDWRVGASFDWLKAKDQSTGLDLLRRARQRLQLQVDGPLASWDVGVQMTASTDRDDSVYKAGASQRVKLPGYAVFNVTAQRELAPGVKLLMKVDNLFDREYQMAADYSFDPRAAFVGLNWTFGP
jgi:vitamin B12 transporter